MITKFEDFLNEDWNGYLHFRGMNANDMNDWTDEKLRKDLQDILVPVFMTEYKNMVTSVEATDEPFTYKVTLSTGNILTCVKYNRWKRKWKITYSDDITSDGTTNLASKRVCDTHNDYSYSVMMRILRAEMKNHLNESATESDINHEINDMMLNGILDYMANIPNSNFSIDSHVHVWSGESNVTNNNYFIKINDIVLNVEFDYQIEETKGRRGDYYQPDDMSECVLSNIDITRAEMIDGENTSHKIGAKLDKYIFRLAQKLIETENSL